MVRVGLGVSTPKALVLVLMLALVLCVLVVGLLDIALALLLVGVIDCTLLFTLPSTLPCTTLTARHLDLWWQRGCGARVRGRPQTGRRSRWGGVCMQWLCAPLLVSPQHSVQLQHKVPGGPCRGRYCLVSS